MKITPALNKIFQSLDIRIYLLLSLFILQLVHSFQQDWSQKEFPLANAIIETGMMILVFLITYFGYKVMREKIKNREKEGIADEYVAWLLPKYSRNIRVVQYVFGISFAVLTIILLIDWWTNTYDVVKHAASGTYRYAFWKYSNSSFLFLLASVMSLNFFLNATKYQLAKHKLSPVLGISEKGIHHWDEKGRYHAAWEDILLAELKGSLQWGELYLKTSSGKKLISLKAFDPQELKVFLVKLEDHLDSQKIKSHWTEG